MDRLTTRNSMGIAVLKTPYKCNRCGEETYRLEDHGSGEPIERLARYEELQERGKLLELPVSVGAIMYVFRVNRIIELEVTSIKLIGGGIGIKFTCYNKSIAIVLDYYERDIGVKVFFTKEEAEEVQKRMEDGK